MYHLTCLNLIFFFSRYLFPLQFSSFFFVFFLFLFFFFLLFPVTFFPTIEEGTYKVHDVLIVFCDDLGAETVLDAGE